MLKFINIPSIENFPFIEQSFDSPTLYGLVVKIGKQLNETIIQVNKNTEILENIDVNFDEINQRIDTLNNEFEQLLIDFDNFKLDINAQMTNFENEINSEINSRFTQMYNQLISLMDDYQAVFNANLENVYNTLNDRIDDVVLGQIDVYNPTSGQMENINKVLTDIYDSVRYDALTCTEFDSLQLTATEFDAVEITAYNFDNNGKSILTNL